MNLFDDKDWFVYDNEPSTDVQSHLNLTPLQSQILEQSDGHHATYGCPGSGKTFLITQRVNHLIENCQVSPQSILMITFSRAGVQVMRGRVPHEDVNICTVHSLCYQILAVLGVHNYIRGFRSRPDILNDFQQKRIIEKILDERKDELADIASDTQQFDPNQTTIPEIQQRIGFTNNRYYTTVVNGTRMITSKDPAFDKLMEFYRDEKRKQSKMDFSDLPLFVIDIFLRYPDVRQRFRDMYTYIIIDEAQDISPLLYHVIYMLSNQNVHFLGDNLQTLYSFNGINVETFSYIERIYPKIRKSYLNENHRSKPNIIRLGNRIADEIGLPHKKMVCGSSNDNDDKGKIIYHGQMDNLMREADYILSIIKERQNQFRHGEDIKVEALHLVPSMMILCRTRWQFMFFEMLMFKNNIDYTITNGSGIFQSGEIQDVLSYIKLVSDDDQVAFDAFKRIWTKPFRYLSKDWFNQLTRQGNNWLWARKQNPERRLQPLVENLLQYKYNADKVTLGRWYKTQNQMLADILTLRSMKDAGDIKGMIRYIRSDIGYDTYIIESYGSGSDETSDDVLMLLDQFEDLVCSLNYDDILGLDKIKGSADDKAGIPPVALSTIHGAKGMESSVVFVVGCTDGILPHKKVQSLRDEWMVFYVACTRAEDELHFTSVKTQGMTEESVFLNTVLE